MSTATDSRGLEEALRLTLHKPLHSTTLERMHLLEEADELVAGLPQPQQLSRAILYVAEKSSLPLEDWDLLAGRIPETVPTEEEEAYVTHWCARYPDARTPWMLDQGHTTFAWNRLLEKGLDGLRTESEAALHEAEAAGSPREIRDFLACKADVYAALTLYIRRYGEAAAARGLARPAALCAEVAGPAPATFGGALQLLLLIGNFYSAYTTIVGALGYGRMDQLLLPFYRRDRETGRLTDREAGELFQDFIYKNNLILGRGEHQMGTADSTTGWLRNPTFDSPQYVMLGGVCRDGVYRPNPLTGLFLSCIHPKLKNPVFVYRRTDRDEPAHWDRVCRLLRDNASVLVYNDATCIPAQRYAGVPAEDAADYTVHACNWPDIPGKYHILANLESNPVGRILGLLNSGESFPDMDAFYQALGEGLRRDARDTFGWVRKLLDADPLPGSLTMTECFMEGGASRPRSMRDGGIPYPAVYHLPLNIGTAADILSAIDDVVYTRHICTLPELAAAARTDFQGCETLWRQCREAPKYGVDDDRADKHAVRLMELFTGVVHEESYRDGKQDIFVLNTTITDMWHVGRGAQTPATPDGRRAGAPLSENLSPSGGVSSPGVTALLNSVSKLPLDRICAGAFNLRLREDCVRGEEGIERLKTLLDVYFQRGGMQVQLSVADTQELRQAQREPEKYPDLMVRITGYSAVFVDMCPAAQEEIIRREELG